MDGQMNEWMNGGGDGDDIIIIIITDNDVITTTKFFLLLCLVPPPQNLQQPWLHLINVQFFHIHHTIWIIGMI